MWQFILGLFIGANISLFIYAMILTVSINIAVQKLDFIV